MARKLPNDGTGDTMALQPDEDTVIIADRNNPEAWVQSDTSVEVRSHG